MAPEETVSAPPRLGTSAYGLDVLEYDHRIWKVVPMNEEFTIGQRVRIVRVDDIPYGEKYSYLDATIDRTGVIQESDAQASRYLVRLDDGGALLSLTASCLEQA